MASSAGVTCGGVWQDEHLSRGNVVEERFLGLVGEIDTANGDGEPCPRRWRREREPFPENCGTSQFLRIKREEKARPAMTSCLTRESAP